MKNYLAVDTINNEQELFDTIEDAQEWLEECFFQRGEGYHPDAESCAIFEIKQRVRVFEVKWGEKKAYEHEWVSA